MSETNQDGWKVKLVATWGIVAVTALLMQAVVRLSILTLEPWRDGSMTAFQMGIFWAWVLLNAYTEGYRAFQLRFSPRVVARAVYLGRNPRPLHILLALPFCMSLFHSSRRQMKVSWIMVMAITSVVIIVRMMPQPWRGIVDGGVVVGLAWGVLVMWWLFGRYLLGLSSPEAEDLPELALSAQIDAPAE